jgi:hypothetical protein
MTLLRTTGVLFLLAFASIGLADDKSDEQVVETHRARMKEIAERIRLFVGTERTPDAERKLAPEPVLRYNDASRKLHESALWTWGEGRPAAIMAIEYYPEGQRGKWLFEIASLSPEQLLVEGAGNVPWTAEKPGFTPQPVPDAPPPADTPAARLTQMKQIHRRFAAFESAVIEGRIVLRPLVRPLDRYQDKAAGVIDGAIVTFANGTNPEVLLLLEAHEAPGVPARWQYSLAQMTGGEVAVELDGAEVWRREAADPPAIRESYINGWLTDQE